MKAVVFHGVGDIRVEEVAEPQIEDAHDAVVRITATAICGTDLHMIRGTLPGMEPGTILGHEGVGIVQNVGEGVRDLVPGDRVVIPSTIACGYCSYCRAGYYAQCDNANPNGSLAGTSFYGGPKQSGPFQGLQAEYARVPFAHADLVKIPEEVSDDDALLVSDIFPTGYFAADLAEIADGDVVAVLGCGPVGQFAIASAKLMGAGRVIAVDRVESRLDKAREQGAEIVNFDREDPVEAIRELTGGIGADRVIDAVGIDAEAPHGGPAAARAGQEAQQFQAEVAQAAPQVDRAWPPGGAPSQALSWGVQAAAKAGTFAIIGVYPPQFTSFPVGMAMNKNLTIKAGNCNHRKYIPKLLQMIRAGDTSPTSVLSEVQPLMSAVDAYRAFSTHAPGWMKVELVPMM